MEEIKVTVTGIPDVREALLSISPKLRFRALMKALRGAGNIVKKATQAATPVLNPFSYATINRYRKAGTLKNAISVRPSKNARKAGNMGVFINVRPAKKGQRGAKNPNDPYYWRWINWGWNPGGGERGLARIQGMRERRRLNKIGAPKRKPGVFFLEKGAGALTAAKDQFFNILIPLIQKLNTPKAPPP